MSRLEDLLRRVIREEVARLLPRFEPPAKGKLTIREAAKRYGVSYRDIRELIRLGKLEVERKATGRIGAGKCQFLIPTPIAEAHPELGGKLCRP